MDEQMNEFQTSILKAFSADGAVLLFRTIDGLKMHKIRIDDGDAVAFLEIAKHLHITSMISGNSLEQQTRGLPERDGQKPLILKPHGGRF
jgi:hypothetical protein